MSKAEHTPGPWALTGQDDSWEVCNEAQGTSCSKQISANGNAVAFAVYHTPELWGA